MMYSVKHGRFLVKLARRAIKEYLSSGKIIEPPLDTPPELRNKAGVFTSIYRLYIRGEAMRKSLRGCIGYPLPHKPIVEATIDSAINSAVNDPRFPPMKLNELLQVILEVSILTPPKLLKVNHPKEYLKKIKVGRDGLIIERWFHSGLLLPQVPVEYGWDTEEFLANACMKAGLPPDAWLLDGTKIYVFQSVVFSEIEPEGEVIKLELEKWRGERENLRYKR